jgi:hypothetical protein
MDGKRHSADFHPHTYANPDYYRMDRKRHSAYDCFGNRNHDYRRLSDRVTYRRLTDCFSYGRLSDCFAYGRVTDCFAYCNDDFGYHAEPRRLCYDSRRGNRAVQYAGGLKT